MHSAGFKAKQRNVKKSRAEGATGGRPLGPTQILSDPAAYKRFLHALAPAMGSPENPALESAAAAIRKAQPPGQPCRCNRTTLLRHLHPPKGQPARITLHLLAQMRHAAEATSPEALADLHLATLPVVVQQRMEMHFDWLKTFRPFLGTPAYWSVKHDLYSRYNYPGKVIWEFRNWMDRHFIRPGRKEIAIWRVLMPLIEHDESGGIEPTWRDFLDGDGDQRLVDFLQLGVDREKWLLELRGNDLHRAHASRIIPPDRPDPTSETPSEESDERR
jgi:hypothetical protein